MIIACAKNTQSALFRVGNPYYLCFQATGFVSIMAGGPWEAAGKVPPEIYSTPERSPRYNAT
ncbi:MAG: hypothetical protein J0L64_06550 [Acidobacteria bacterium]|nr:hypothetical protein [Acidobacteriota bacterium]